MGLKSTIKRRKYIQSTLVHGNKTFEKTFILKNQYIYGFRVGTKTLMEAILDGYNAEMDKKVVLICQLFQQKKHFTFRNYVILHLKFNIFKIHNF